MIEFLNQINYFCKILSLNNKDINNVFQARNLKSNVIIILFLLILSALITIFILFILNISGIYLQEHTYQTGTKYSTVKIQDFSKKNENKHRLWKKVRTWIY